MDVLVAKQQPTDTRANRETPYKQARRNERALIDGYIHLLFLVVAAVRGVRNVAVAVGADQGLGGGVGGVGHGPEECFFVRSQCGVSDSIREGEAGGELVGGVRKEMGEGAGIWGSFGTTAGTRNAERWVRASTWSEYVPADPCHLHASYLGSK